MIGTGQGVAITQPPEQPLEVQGLLRLCADPGLATALLEHRDAWEQIHKANKAVLAQMAKIRDIEGAKAKAETTLRNARARLESAESEADNMLARAKSDADEIARLAKRSDDGLAQRSAELDAQAHTLAQDVADLDKRERAITVKEAATVKARTDAAADRKAAATGRARIDAMLAGVK